MQFTILLTSPIKQITSIWSVYLIIFQQEDRCRSCHSLEQHNCFLLQRVFFALSRVASFRNNSENRNDVIITSKLIRCSLDFYTINRTKVPTFSPRLMKIRPIISEIISRKCSHTDTQFKFVGATVHRLTINYFSYLYENAAVTGDELVAHVSVTVSPTLTARLDGVIVGFAGVAEILQLYDQFPRYCSQIKST